MLSFLQFGITPDSSSKKVLHRLNFGILCYADDCKDNEEHGKVNEAQPETLDHAWNWTKSSRASISLARDVFSKAAASFIRA